MDNISSSSEEKLSPKLKFSKFNPLSFGLGILLGAMFILALIGLSETGFFSSKQEGKISQVFPETSSEISKTIDKTSLSDEEAAQAFLKFREIKNAFIPSGIPAVYGQELNISFDAVQEAINKVRVFDPTYGKGEKKINLIGADLERYIKIGSQTACQYCCGAKTLVRKNGEAACGCAHSAMMRGLAAYLIKNHPELSDEQILKELNTWKITYFPKQTLTAELDRRLKAGDTGIKTILEEFPEFLPQMVGGC